MASKIEQLIEEIEDYIDGCKFKPLSSTYILVEKQVIEDLLRELKMKTPEEIRHYQKIIANKEAILNDAKQKAQALLDETTVHTNELINEHEIMQQAYQKANEIVTLATQEAQIILDNATMQANQYKGAAVSYVDDTLASIEELLTNASREASAHYDNLLSSLAGYNELVKTNRSTLYPAEETAPEVEAFEEEIQEVSVEEE